MRIKDWLKKYPDHCEYCMGAGGHTTLPTQWEPPDFGLCQCLEEGYCPRCNFELFAFFDLEEFIVEEYACPSCGWDWGKGVEDSCPEESSIEKFLEELGI